jgi:hypothetical protein
MPRHDYDLPPPGVWEQMDSDEKDRWFKQERARRRAMKQDTPMGEKLREQCEQS